MTNCRYCSGCCVKAGKSRREIQIYRCKQCQKYQQVHYKNLACQLETNRNIVRLLIEGMGIRSMARVLRISMSTIIDRIKCIAKSLKKSYSFVKNRVYEIDELWTFIGSKQNETWITYCIDRATKEVIDFRVGARTKEML